MVALGAQEMVDLWQRHVFAEFVQKDPEAALATMTEDAHVLLIPVGLGGWGKDGVRRFYAESFIPNIPPDIAPLPISQTVGTDRLVEEAIYRFTHTIAMDWMLPGIAPTNKPVELALVGIIEFRDGKIASEHLYWDQASVLAQLGIIPADTPAVGGSEGNRRLRELVQPHG
jgi:carboxymethylenebutenolidase